jgi:hypothetical protein
MFNIVMSVIVIFVSTHFQPLRLQAPYVPLFASNFRRKSVLMVSGCIPIVQ